MCHAGSDVMGCRRPTGGIFSYVSSDRVTLRAFPVATPRGRSSSSHEGEHGSFTEKKTMSLFLYDGEEYKPNVMSTHLSVVHIKV